MFMQKCMPGTTTVKTERMNQPLKRQYQLCIQAKRRIKNKKKEKEESNTIGKKGKK
jgi:hypothetical protein